MSFPQLTAEQIATLRPIAAGGPSANGASGFNSLKLTISTAEAFAAVDEPGADPIVGERDDVLIPAGGDVMIYGDGGAGKTSLALDAGCHMAAAKDWLGYQIPRPVSVLVIENEGPRALMRRKVARKLEKWPGPPVGGRLVVMEDPWAQFTFASAEWRSALVQAIKDREIDVLIVGPLVRIGMDSAGTLQDIVAFMVFVTEVRVRCMRRLAVILIHHENKGGTVSGAWEGACDTLMHVEARGNGYTHVRVEKARWSSSAHNTTLDLAWTEAEGFAIKEERDLLAEIEKLFSDRMWRTLDEIRAGIGAGKGPVHEVLEAHPERFAMRTGEDARALGRRSNSRLYQLAGAA